MTTNKFRKFFRSLKLLYGLFDEALQKQKKKKTILLTYRFFRRGRERERERERGVRSLRPNTYLSGS